MDAREEEVSIFQSNLYASVIDYLFFQMLHAKKQKKEETEQREITQMTALLSKRRYSAGSDVSYF
jgi:nicotinamide riboside transporter PnuC